MMNLNFKNKALGFYLAAVAVVLTLIATILYGIAPNQTGISLALVIVALLAGVAVVVGKMFCAKEAITYGVIVCAILASVAIVLSVNSQLDQIGYVFAGLDPFSTIAAYVAFAVIQLVAVILFLVVAFIGMDKA